MLIDRTDATHPDDDARSAARHAIKSAIRNDRRGRSLGRFAEDEIFEHVLRAAEVVPLDERTHGVRF